MNPLIQNQIGLNATTRDRWETFSNHRQRIMALLAPDSQSGERICILGAGNCNDLDLPILAAAFQEVVLVDLDGESLESGIRRQGMWGQQGGRAVGGLDVTGKLGVLSTWQAGAILGQADIDDLAHASALADLAGRCDVVASTCLLTQLVAGLVHSIGNQHAQFIPAVQKIRLGHFRLLASLLRPGGRLVFACDVVSSDTCPDLGMDGGRLAAQVDELIRRRNFFTGTSPAAVRDMLQGDAVLATGLEEVESVPPWVWSIGTRRYAVYGLTARRPAPGR